MEKFKVSFVANNQQLTATGTKHASDTYADIEATFALGERWTDMDSVSAVWWNDFTRIATVLDSEGKCTVPHEVLMRKGCVRVNLVGSVVENGELVTRLTSYSAEAVHVNEKIKLTGSETTEITPSQFEQFVENVKADADRAESAKESAQDASASAQGYAQSASASASSASESATSAEQSATASARDAQTVSEIAVEVEVMKNEAELARDEILGMSAEAVTLPAGSEATASYADGLLSLGIPRGNTGATGAKGDRGDTGATPNLTIGTVETLEPTQDAYVTRRGTDDNPIFDFGIPKGDTGDVSQAQLDEAVTDLKSDFKHLGVLQKGEANDGAILFTSDSVKEGDIFYYNFDALSAYSGYIDILNTSGTRITYIGKGSSDFSPDTHFEGSYTIPANFGKVKVVARKGSSDLQYITINYAISNNLIKSLFDRIGANESGIDSIESDISSVETFRKKTGLLYKGDLAHNAILFDSNDVNAGDVFSYSFDRHEGYSGYIDILNTSGTRITYIGAGSSSVTVSHYEGSYIIPSNFGKAVITANRGGTTDSITFDYAITNKLIADAIADINASNLRWSIYDYNCNVKNRLANPIYTTFEKVNDPETIISREIPLDHVQESVDGYYRIPTTIITNAGSILVATERRDNGNAADKGKISIDLVRKTSGGSWGTVTTVLSYNATYGRYMDPCFVIDRTGAHGTAGRIYLFAGTFLNDDVTWSYNTYEECNMVYIYSDDDGVTWSEQTSVKSKWDATEISVLPAPANGIQLTNGTLVIPVFGYDGTRHNNSLFYKKVGEDWAMASKNDVVSYNINENTIAEYATNKVKIYCNNGVAFPRTQYPSQFDRFCTPTFTYDFSTDEYTQIESTFDRNVVCQFSVYKTSDYYLMSFPDDNNNQRSNITIWASKDGEQWIRCFKAYSLSSNGYSVITEYGDEIALVFEDHNGNISYEDLTSLESLFDNSINYIDNISSQDRMQMMINELT